LCPPHPSTKPQNGDVRKEIEFTDETGANIGVEICTCGPTQLNIHLEGVFDHGEKHNFSFFRTSHVLEAARRQC